MLSRRLTGRSLLFLLFLIVTACQPIALATPTPAPSPIREPATGTVVVTPIVIEPTGAPSATATAAIIERLRATPTSTAYSDPLIDLGAGPIPSTPEASTRVLTAFDSLLGYLANRTHADVLPGIPWTNSTINFEQYQRELQGVTYWDFVSEPENWDSPSYMWLDDAGAWRPYAKTTLRTPNGDLVSGYELFDRVGPGAMDKLWFTEDAVWMLTTDQSRRDVGPIESMDDFIEWGNLDKLGNLRLEVDGRIAYDGSLRAWLSGEAWGLTPELARLLTWRHREFGSSGSLLPVLYQKRLRATLYGGTKKPKWFLATGLRFPEPVQVQAYRGSGDLPVAEMGTLTHFVTAPETYIESQPDVRALDLTVAPAAAAAVQFRGAGTVAALTLRVKKTVDPQKLWLRVSYGDATGNRHAVGINLPLIAFFGDPRVLVPHRSTPLGILDQEDAYLFYSNWPLPFQDGLRFEIATNGTAPAVVSARFAVSRAHTSTRLEVNYNAGERLSAYGPDYVVRLPGNGKLVGLLLASDEQNLDQIEKIYASAGSPVEDPVRRAWPMGYLEGNLTLTDGAGHSRIYGGQEDWADGGFYFNRGYTEPPGGSNRPFAGILRYRDGPNGYATIFRYLSDLSAFPFSEGMTLSFGHGTWNNNFPVRYATVVFYYRLP